MIYTELSPKQIQAMLWWSQPDTRNHDAIVCDGSVRSGITLAGVLLDEVALMPKSFVEQALARCSVTGISVDCGCLRRVLYIRCLTQS